RYLHEWLHLEWLVRELFDEPVRTHVRLSTLFARPYVAALARAARELDKADLTAADLRLALTRDDPDAGPAVRQLRKARHARLHQLRQPDRLGRIFEGPEVLHRLSDDELDARLHLLAESAGGLHQLAVLIGTPPSADGWPSVRGVRTLAYLASLLHGAAFT